MPQELISDISKYMRTHVEREKESNDTLMRRHFNHKIFLKIVLKYYAKMNQIQCARVCERERKKGLFLS